MDQVLAGLDYVFVYLDDILIASLDERTHQQHLRAVLERLQEGGLVLNAEKCLFGVSPVEFLDYHITAEGGGNPSTEGGSHRRVPVAPGRQGHAAVPGGSSREPLASSGRSRTRCAASQEGGWSGRLRWERPSRQPRTPCAQPAG
jgi:hypothetical protein